MANRRRIGGSKLWLVMLGVGLGLLARLTFGVPDQGKTVERKFKETIPESMGQQDDLQEEIDIPLDPELLEDNQPQGLVPPLEISGEELQQVAFTETQFFADEHRAEFEPHGHEVCASGCALSRHPTPTLSRDRFLQLVRELEQGRMDGSNAAFEELLYFGAQTKSHLHYVKIDIADEWLDLLNQELEKTFARIEIRVVDEYGEVRSWLPSTVVPLDRRHVFKMDTHNVQPLETSGTVKRVGLNHLWARL